ncbi:MAG: NAD(P)/FAD-dependent oxidoreductase, partial [Candidatus Dormibacteraeota bacterium]|nr:NAD(P)/FAD-dependent oxidoreductase [Candidatus Dormibacteraeota bacterium]
MSAEQYDAVVVGAGPNGLTAAVMLARQGLGVLVLEGASTPGGGARTAEMTLPGFRHDVCSAVHPLGAGSPVFRSLPLEEHGLRWLEAPVALAHPFDDGPPATLLRSVDGTAASLGIDSAAYRRLVAPFIGRWDELAPDALRPVTASLPHHPLLLARFGVRGMAPVAALTALMRGRNGPALLAGIAAHAISPARALTTGGVALLFAIAGHEVGWPVPAGGSQSISDALVSLLEAHGGTVECDRPVRSLDDVPSARAVLLD